MIRVLAAGVDDHHPRAADAGVAGDGEAASFDDVGAAVHGERGVSRDADLAVDAGLDRRGRIAAEALGAIIGQAGGARLSAARPADRQPPPPPVVGAGLKLALPLFWTPPCTSITEALTAALPLADRALDELEST